MINPIEFSFGKIKTYIRNETAINPELTLIDVAKQAMDTITGGGLAGYCDHILQNSVHAFVGRPFD